VFTDSEQRTGSIHKPGDARNERSECWALPESSSAPDAAMTWPTGWEPRLDGRQGCLAATLEPE